MIDHVAEALRLAELGDASYGSTKQNGAVGATEAIEALMIVTEAQVHATLALVEQKRIANLIALFTLSDADSADFATHGVDYTHVLLEIKEGLGL